MSSPKPVPQNKSNVRSSGLYIDTKRTSFHLSCSQEEQRAAAFFSLTGEECPHPLNLYRQREEELTDRSHSKYKKAQPKYRSEDSPNNETDRNYRDQDIEDWVDGISQSTISQDFETAPRSPTTEMMANAAVRLNPDDQQAAKESREAQKPKKKQKPLGEYTMSSTQSEFRKPKPLGEHTMSSEKAQGVKSAYDSLSSVSRESPHVAVRGEVQHQHHHYHHFHSISAESSGRTNGEVWVTRDHSGQLQYERRSNSQRSRSRKYNESGSDGVTAAKGFSDCQIM